MHPLWLDFVTACATAGVPTPAWRVLHGHAELEAAVQAVGLPLVARPLSPAGEYCAMRADHAADAALAFSRARSQGEGGAVLVQALPQASAETVYVVHAAHGDDGWEVSPLIEVSLLPQYALTPIAFLSPAALAAADAETLMDAARRVLAALPEGRAHARCEFVLTASGPWAVFASDTAMPCAREQEVLGLAERHGAACIEFLTPNSGVVEHVEGIDAARAGAGVLEVRIEAIPGSMLRHVTSIPARDAGGYVVAVGETPAEARERTHRAAAAITIVGSAFA